MEVATARVYNWEVVQKRKDKDDPEQDKSNAGENNDPPND